MNPFARGVGRWIPWPALGLAGALALLAAAPGTAVPPLDPLAATASVQARVTDQGRVPIPGASALLPALGLAATSDAEGLFTWRSIDLPQDPYPVTLTVTAPGFGNWTIRDVRLVRDDILYLDIQMGPDPVEILVPPPASGRSSFPREQTAPGLFEDPSVDQTGLPIPRTIRVRVTGYPYCDTSRPYTVHVIDFLDYARHVLPNEWGASWPGESLRAGAMAVKMYAWSYIAAGGKWPDADVYDSTCDQVYNPAVSYASTTNAVNFTWDWRLLRDNELVRTFYRAYVSQCPGPDCMGQWESRDMAYDRYSWDEILKYFYTDTEISSVNPPPGGWSLRYEGNGYGDLDRVKFLLDGPPRPIDVGAGDFTVEWWMQANPGENGSGACTPGGDNWVRGNIVLDRDVFGSGDYGDYGVSLAAGRLAFGVNNGTESQTLCGSRLLADAGWHHVAVTRRASDGWMAIYIDGTLDVEGDGPDGDISYRDGRTTLYADDPYLVVAAEKHDLDSDQYPSFRGWVDEIRISNAVRYTGLFPTPPAPFGADSQTMGLYHFDIGYGNTIADSSGAPGGPSPGWRSYGGVINGPEWTSDTPWQVEPSPTPTVIPPATATSSGPTPTPTRTHTPTRTPTATASATVPPTATFTPSMTPTPTPLGPGDVVPSLAFVEVADGLAQPVFVTDSGDLSGRLFVIERAGRVRLIDPQAGLLGQAFLDITPLVRSSGSEEGLLGLAFHPAYLSNGRFFVAYNNAAGDLALAAYSVSADPDLADPASGQILLTVPHPTNSNHNGGMLAFGPDGYLYWSTGDGGGAGDPANNAQNLNSLLGKILRLDVDAASPYAIPADNPFVGVSGAREEIWAYGLRNPWRFSFDRATGDVYIGDVGQSQREEIDFQAASSAGGLNYGWRVMEGSLCFNPSSGCDTSGKVLPIVEYVNNAATCAVTGGYVYRGAVFPTMQGIYLYGDYCSGQIWGLLRQPSGAWDADLIEDTAYFISSFGEDEAGELYLVDYAGGAIQRIVGPSDPTPVPTRTPSILPGDVDQSGSVDVVDLQLCVNVVLGTEPTPRVVELSDLNGDGEVNVIDVQSLVNIILQS